jgi:hypothetical protein
MLRYPDWTPTDWENLERNGVVTRIGIDKYLKKARRLKFFCLI